MPPLVLLVDDSPDLTRAYRVLFEGKGYRVAVAADVAGAVRACEEAPPDLMLLDVKLPDGEGVDVLTRLGATGALPRVTVALTGHDDDPALAQRYRDAGCREVLVKGHVPIGDLLRRVEAWLAADGR